MTLGSDAEQIARVAPVPVLLVREREHAAEAIATDAAERAATAATA
jgi:hypothetical protein